VEKSSVGGVVGPAFLHRFLPDYSPEFESRLQERNVVGWKYGKHLETFVHPRLNDTLDD